MRRHVIRNVAGGLTAAMILAACVSSGGGAASPSASASTESSAGSSTSTSKSSRRDRTVITEEELKQTNASNLFEAVQRLHPEWLIARNGATVAGSRSAGAATGANDVQVYLDTQRAGSVDMLKQITTTRATTLRYYSASEAQARFGNGNLNGVIQVVTAPGR
jgi:hypothetical protein